MTDETPTKVWAWHPDGVIVEVVELPAEWVPGRDIYTPEHAADMSDVSALTPRPDQGWTTADGGETFAAPAVPAPPVPASVSSAQAKIQCLRTPGAESGKTLLDDIADAARDAGGEAAIWFSDARTWERANPYVASLSSRLKLTPEQVDQLFIEAAQIAA
jgi:hypothetical protein